MNRTIKILFNQNPQSSPDQEIQIEAPEKLMSLYYIVEQQFKLPQNSFLLNNQNLGQINTNENYQQLLMQSQEIVLRVQAENNQAGLQVDIIYQNEIYQFTLKLAPFTQLVEAISNKVNTNEQIQIEYYNQQIQRQVLIDQNNIYQFFQYFQEYPQTKLVVNRKKALENRPNQPFSSESNLQGQQQNLSQEAMQRLVIQLDQILDIQLNEQAQVYNQLIERNTQEVCNKIEQLSKRVTELQNKLLNYEINTQNIQSENFQVEEQMRQFQFQQPNPNQLIRNESYQNFNQNAQFQNNQIDLARHYSDQVSNETQKNLTQQAQLNQAGNQVVIQAKAFEAKDIVNDFDLVFESQ